MANSFPAFRCQVLGKGPLSGAPDSSPGCFPLLSGYDPVLRLDGVSFAVPFSVAETDPSPWYFASINFNHFTRCFFRDPSLRPPLFFSLRSPSSLVNKRKAPPPSQPYKIRRNYPTGVHDLFLVENLDWYANPAPPLAGFFEPNFLPFSPQVHQPAAVTFFPPSDELYGPFSSYVDPLLAVCLSERSLQIYLA